VAVVTGGGVGIGGAISRLFAQHGALVEIVEIDPDRAAAAVDAIEAIGGTARAHVVDVASDAEVEDLRVAVVGEHGRVDVLVNNVGDYRPLVRFHESTPESWQTMYSTNLEHVFRVTRAFLGPMVEGGGGSIVNVHSVEGMRGFPGEPVYAAMKAAVAHFTTSLAAGYGRKGIRVNGIGPKLGLTLLSSLTPEEFAASVADQDVAAMTRVPGVGKKTAERLLMELKDRLDTLPVGITRGATNKESTAREAELALVSLGYRPLDAARAIDNVYAAGEPVEELIRMALQRMTTNV
jgi:NAD(P)-dependent dehydrogenase (short-subunit alcohol dehydrogenase family)